jgi:phospholipase/carboxylesterase
MTVRYVLDGAHTMAAASSPPVPQAEQATADAAPSLTAWLRFLKGDSSEIFSTGETGGAESPVIWFPEYYEPRYAYPLIVWIQGPGRTADADFRTAMETISDRNYMGIALRTTLYNAADDATDYTQLASRLRHLVGLVRRKQNIHGERIFVAGLGRAATIALRLGLSQPQWFAGIIAPGAELFPQPEPHQPLLREYRQLLGKRVLLGAFNDVAGQSGRTAEQARLLHASGMRVCERQYESLHQPPRSLFTDIDRWIMREIYTAQTVAS